MAGSSGSGCRLSAVSHRGARSTAGLAGCICASDPSVKSGEKRSVEKKGAFALGGYSSPDEITIQDQLGGVRKLHQQRQPDPLPSGAVRKVVGEFGLTVFRLENYAQFGSI